MEQILIGEGLSKSFGGVRAVDEASLVVRRAEVVGLIGPNGAGKSTLINLLSGLFRPDRGKVLLAGQDVTALSSETRTEQGLLRTFQQVRAFRSFTVAGAFRLAAQGRRARSRLPKDPSAEITETADRFGLIDVMPKVVGELSYGLQKILNLALVSLSAPLVLLLDEPFAGVQREDISRISDIIADLARREIAVCLVEHDMEAVMRLCQRIVVLDAGAQIFEGTPEACRSDANVRRVYLGELAEGSS